ncbi:hypothetical protein UCRPC4_g03317 [Phaeomoniella chlamydospora]|uniref:Uncharacterized protein n=1 Tax=Phaeomoniella chlamydospora TaxID=158046 RepID=A0A0G2EIU5_PHACM|nr:hypothetical protein UCRPC4_g03317 [Phaeomoniella chlamydospora]
MVVLERKTTNAESWAVVKKNILLMRTKKTEETETEYRLLRIMHCQHPAIVRSSNGCIRCWAAHIKCNIANDPSNPCQRYVSEIIVSFQELTASVNGRLYDMIPEKYPWPGAYVKCVELEMWKYVTDLTSPVGKVFGIAREYHLVYSPWAIRIPRDRTTAIDSSSVVYHALIIWTARQLEAKLKDQRFRVALIAYFHLVLTSKPLTGEVDCSIDEESQIIIQSLREIAQDCIPKTEPGEANKEEDWESTILRYSHLLKRKNRGQGPPYVFEASKRTLDLLAEKTFLIDKNIMVGVVMDIFTKCATTTTPDFLEILLLPSLIGLLDVKRCQPLDLEPQRGPS